MDSEAIIDSLTTATPRSAGETARAHRVVRTHLPERDWRWLGARLRCRHCGQRYPCPPRRHALSHLARGLRQPDVRVSAVPLRSRPDRDTPRAA